MSGHNRWSKLKRQKAAMGATKGKLFSKLIKEVTVAARLGGGDPAGNARLRVALALAREANIPSDSIVRAVKKGTGELEGAHYEEVTYEGYGPGGVAVIVECMTDNRNRTAGEVRSTFTSGGGNLAAAGAVSWMFHRHGVITVAPGASEEAVMAAALDAGADDVLPQDGEGASPGAPGFEVRTEPSQLHAVASALERAGLTVTAQKWSYFPETTVKLEGDAARKMLKLMDQLEDSDDVQQVHANFEISEELLEQLS